ncbi:hypothetical protein RND81_14G010200 [Saponaria officinalis]|uniref:Uncharacterized protein n=1 Tax=Saponaria officinalis TaxID=3572 RepID=A0AAW1GJZ0_SAPOF
MACYTPRLLPDFCSVFEFRVFNILPHILSSHTMSCHCTPSEIVLEKTRKIIQYPSEELFSEQNIDQISNLSDESISEQKQHEEKTDSTEYCLLTASDALTDSESITHTTSHCSDGSISDEDLIEIELPTGHYVDSEKWYGIQQKWSDCSLESHFRQQNWIEMLNEMNEENFIEIDLCMGSIKCSRFAIQA